MAALGTRALVLTIGGTDYTTQISNCRVTSQASDSDFTTFADAAAGGARLYQLEGTMVQDTATGTFWDKIWTAAGTSVAYLLKPSGNSAASTSQPHYSGNLTIKEPDGDMIGGEANASTTARFTLDFAFPLDAKPTKVTT